MPAERSGSLAEQVRRFAAGAAADGAWRYERICAGIAEDPELLALLCEAPESQRRPNILLAAVHFLLLRGEEDALVRHYPTVLEWRRHPADPSSGQGEDPFPAFAGFCRRHRDRLASLVATRATQTNEVGRCAALLPALATVASRVDKPLAVLDLGTSAGLNLLFDRYAYDYQPGGRVGAVSSSVTIRCQVRTGKPPVALPPVAARAGVDRAPVDVGDDTDALWLLACQWPDHLDRFATLRAAIDLARRNVRPALLSGDVVEDLARAVATLPGNHEAHLCLVHTWTAAYLDTEAQGALAAAVAGVAHSRPCSWIFAEDPSEVPALPLPPPPDGRRVRGATAVVHAALGPTMDAPVAERLADMHSHGRWLHWYGPPSRAVRSVHPQPPPRPAA